MSMNAIKTLVGQPAPACEEKGPGHTSLCRLLKGSQALCKVLANRGRTSQETSSGAMLSFPLARVCWQLGSDLDLGREPCPGRLLGE